MAVEMWGFVRNLAFLQLNLFIHVGETIVMSSILFAVQSTVPNTYTSWGLSEFLYITGACLLCLFIIPRVVWYPHVGPKMPLPFPSAFNNPSVGTFLAAMAAGHILGVGAVLGLTNLGVL